MTPVRVAAVGVGMWGRVLADAAGQGTVLDAIVESLETGRAVLVGSKEGRR